MIFTIREKILLRWLKVSFNYTSFTQLYNLYTKAAFQLALRLTSGDRLVAERIVQNTWVAVIENLSGYSRKIPFQDWLVSFIVRNTIEHYRKENCYILIDDNPNEFVNSGFSRFLKKEVTMHYQEAFSLLPIGLRYVFILHDIYRYKHKTIAEFLSISEGHSKSYLFKSRIALRQLTGEATRSNRYRDWSERERKTFTASYCNVPVPKELREKVMGSLYDKGLIVVDDSRYSMGAAIVRALRVPVLWRAGV